MKPTERHPLRLAPWGAILFAGATLLSPPVHAAPGDLDLSFATTGFTRAGFFHGDDYGMAMVTQFDGKFLVAGYADFGGLEFALYRYNVDGSPDASFGENGKELTSLGLSDCVATAIMLQGVDKFIVAGYGDSRIALARYNLDGSLDASFGVGGKVLTASADVFEGPVRAVLQADGKIVVAATYQDPVVFNVFAVLRFNADGAMDASFDGDGIAITSFLGNRDNEPYAVMIQPDGKIVAAGTTSTTGSDGAIAVARFNTDGSLDTSFDGDGKVVTRIGSIGKTNDVARTIAAQVSTHVEQKIVVGGYSYSLGTNYDFALVRYNYNGSLDTTLGGDGIAVTPVTAGSDFIQKIAIQSSAGNPNRIIAAGYADIGSDHDFVVAKYFLDGTLDPSFSGDGIATTAIGSGNDEAWTMVIASGKYVAAGFSRSASSGYDCALVRYNADGSLDATFDGDGKRTDDLGSGPAYAQAVVVQPDDKVVAAGFCRGADSTYDFAVARFAADGSLDPTFDGDGRVTTAISAGDDKAYAALLQPDGKVVAAGRSTGAFPANDLAVVRYNADGTLDPTFSSDGIQVTPLASGAEANAVALQPDQKIIVAGTALVGGREDFALVRYAADGSLDASFGTGGEVTTPVGTGGAEGNGIALQPDGKIVVAGFAVAGGSHQFAVARYNPDGTLDASFDGDGVATTAMEANGAQANALAIQADGKIVVAGYTNDGTRFLVAVARYDTSGSLDPTFDGDGKRTVTVGTDSQGYAVATQPNGKIVVAGYSAIASSDDFLLLRLLPDGSLDAGYGAGGSVLVDFGGSASRSNAGAAIAMDSEGRAVVAGPSSGVFTSQPNEVFGVARVLGDGASTAAPEGPFAAVGFQLGTPRPNPARGRTEIPFSLPTPGRLTAQVFDVSGRLVSEIARGQRFDAGSHSLAWDGRDNAGALVSSGVYFVQLRNGAQSQAQRLTVLR